MLRHSVSIKALPFHIIHDILEAMLSGETQRRAYGLVGIEPITVVLTRLTLVPTRRARVLTVEVLVTL